MPTLHADEEELLCSNAIHNKQAASLVCSHTKAKAGSQTLSFRICFQFRLFIPELFVFPTLIWVLMALEHRMLGWRGCWLAWDALLARLLSCRAERHKLPVWLPFKWVKTTAKLNYIQAIRHCRHSTAPVRVVQTGLCKRGFIQGQTYPMLSNVQAALLILAAARCFSPWHQRAKGMLV